MVAAAITAAAAVASAASSMSASGAQQGAASSASNTQNAMYQQERADLLPFMQTGYGANTALQNLAGVGLDSNGALTGDPLSSSLLKAPSMNFSESDLQNTPGYQFNLSQGLKGVQNSAAARGLGTSGSALKGAAGYATGLADSTYQNQFNNAVTNQSNQFNRLMGLANLGQSSAANVGNAGITTGQGIASNTIGGGNAGAAGILGAGNALSSAYPNYLVNNLFSGGGNAPDGMPFGGGSSGGINWGAYA